MVCGSERTLQSGSDGNLSMDGASTGAIGGEVGLVFIFWLLLVPVISIPIFDSI
jgi:hypothetical protein